MKIDFGCGMHKKEGFLGVDNRAFLNPDIVGDVRHPIPGLAAGCADEIYCAHVMEHIQGEDWHLVMMEMARLLKSGGKFEIRVPHPSSDCCMVVGHIHVHTPYWWECCRREDWLRGKLIIDTIEERPDPRAVEDGMFEGPDAPPAKIRHYLRNIYLETLVLGHKP